MNLVERQINNILLATKFEDAEEIRREKIFRIGERLIYDAVGIFNEIPEFREEAVMLALPDLTHTRKKDSPIGFFLGNTLIEVNFFPSKVSNNHFSLSLYDCNHKNARENLRVSTYHASSKNPNTRIRVEIEKEGVLNIYDGAQAAFIGSRMLRKVYKLNWESREYSG